MPYPLDGSPGFFIFPIAEKGVETDEIKDKPEKDIFDQAHDAGPKYILTADADILRIDPLEKCRDRQNGAVNGKQQIEPEHKRRIEHPHHSSENRRPCL